MEHLAQFIQDVAFNSSRLIREKSYSLLGKRLPTETRIVTAADFTHEKSLLNLLGSISMKSSYEVVVWDLGLSELARFEIKSRYPFCEVHKFAFESFPSHMNIRVNAGEYAWKPVIIHMSARGYKGLLIWSDAGNILSDGLDALRWMSHRFGFFSPMSSGVITEWTHQGTLDALKVDEELASRPNLNGAVIGFNCHHKSVRALLESWRACAMNKSCIAPEGSSRLNHRQDQSALSILARQHRLVLDSQLRLHTQCLRIRTHQDVER
jgi:hypothetical protein